MSRIALPYSPEQRAKIRLLVEAFRRGEDPEVDYAIGATMDGDSCDPRVSTSPRDGEYCYRGKYRLCDLTKCGGAVLNVPASSAFQVGVLPVNVPFFEPVAASIEVRENANPTAVREVRISAVAIAGKPQEAFDDRAPTGATVAFSLSSEYERGNDGPLPVPWGVFSNQGNSNLLLIFGFNHNTVPVDVMVTTYGNPRSDFKGTMGEPWAPGPYAPAWRR